MIESVSPGGLSGTKKLIHGEYLKRNCNHSGETYERPGQELSSQ